MALYVLKQVNKDENYNTILTILTNVQMRKVPDNPRLQKPLNITWVISKIFIFIKWSDVSAVTMISHGHCNFSGNLHRRISLEPIYSRTLKFVFTWIVFFLMFIVLEVLVWIRLSTFTKDWKKIFFLLYFFLYRRYYSLYTLYFLTLLTQ